MSSRPRQASPTDRAIRLACQGVIILWIAAFLSWRDLAPREVNVPLRTTAIETAELPPPEPLAEAEPEPEPAATVEPEPEPDEPAVAEAPPPPPPEPAAEVATPEPPPEHDAPLEAAAIPELAGEPAPQEPEPLPEVVAEAPQPEPEPMPEVLPEPEPVREAPVAPPERVADAPPRQAEPPPPTRNAPTTAPRNAPTTAPAERPPPPAPLVTVRESDVARGGTLLSGSNGFPALESRYEGYGSFRQYAQAMERLGARFVVVNARKIVGTIDPWTLETGELANPAELSPRARDFSGEPQLARVGRAVRTRHGHRAEVMMLVPRRIDAGLFGGIARALEARGREPSSFRQIRARYERGPGDTLRLRVEAAIRPDGGEEPLPLLFDLDGLARPSRV